MAYSTGDQFSLLREALPGDRVRLQRTLGLLMILQLALRWVTVALMAQAAVRAAAATVRPSVLMPEAASGRYRR